MGQFHRPEFLDTSRALTQAAHEALGGAPGTRPLVVDPFAGGGSIPLEALRVGADAFASDLNPIPVLLNKVVLEYIPKYGQRLADEVRKWGEWIKSEAEKELAEFYPKDPDGATPIAYLWARTIQCEGPGCGAEVPLIRSLWLAKKPNRSVALQLVPRPRAKRVDFQIIVKQRGGWVNQDDPKDENRRPAIRRHGQTRFRHLPLLRIHNTGRAACANNSKHDAVGQTMHVCSVSYTTGQRTRPTRYRSARPRETSRSSKKRADRTRQASRRTQRSTQLGARRAS